MKHTCFKETQRKIKIMSMSFQFVGNPSYSPLERGQGVVKKDSADPLCRNDRKEGI